MYLNKDAKRTNFVILSNLNQHLQGFTTQPNIPQEKKESSVLPSLEGE